MARTGAQACPRKLRGNRANTGHGWRPVRRSGPGRVVTRVIVERGVTTDDLHGLGALAAFGGRQVHRCEAAIEQFNLDIAATAGIHDEPSLGANGWARLEVGRDPAYSWGAVGQAQLEGRLPGHLSRPRQQGRIDVRQTDRQVAITAIDDAGRRKHLTTDADFAVIRLRDTSVEKRAAAGCAQGFIECFHDHLLIAD